MKLLNNNLHSSAIDVIVALLVLSRLHQHISENYDVYTEEITIYIYC